MRALTTLLISLSAVATATGQSNGSSQGYGQQYAQPSVQQSQQAPRSYYSGSTYSQSSYPPQATYSRSAYPPGYAPANSYYAYPQQDNYQYGHKSHHGNSYGHGNVYYANPHNSVNPQSIASQPQVQQPQFGAGFGTTFTDRVRQQANPQIVVGTPQQPPLGAGFGPTYTDQVQRAAQVNAHLQHEIDQRRNLELWKQYQVQQQAYFHRYGPPAAQQFWQDIYGYNRSTHNQSQSGYSFQGQSQTGQNQNGYSNFNQSRSGQAYSNPGSHVQSRFNQSQPNYSFHNIVVPHAGHWHR